MNMTILISDWLNQYLRECENNHSTNGEIPNDIFSPHGDIWGHTNAGTYQTNICTIHSRTYSME